MIKPMKINVVCYVTEENTDNVGMCKGTWNVSFLECEGQVLIDNFAIYAANVLADERGILLVRGMNKLQLN